MDDMTTSTSTSTATSTLSNHCHSHLLEALLQLEQYSEDDINSLFETLAQSTGAFSSEDWNRVGEALHSYSPSLSTTPSYLLLFSNSISSISITLQHVQHLTTCYTHVTSQLQATSTSTTDPSMFSHLVNMWLTCYSCMTTILTSIAQHEICDVLVLDAMRNMWQEGATMSKSTSLPRDILALIQPSRTYQPLMDTYITRVATIQVTAEQVLPLFCILSDLCYRGTQAHINDPALLSSCWKSILTLLRSPHITSLITHDTHVMSQIAHMCINVGNDKLDVVEAVITSLTSTSPSPSLSEITSRLTSLTSSLKITRFILLQFQTMIKLIPTSFTSIISPFITLAIRAQSIALTPVLLTSSYRDLDTLITSCTPMLCTVYLNSDAPLPHKSTLITSLSVLSSSYADITSTSHLLFLISILNRIHTFDDVDVIASICQHIIPSIYQLLPYAHPLIFHPTTSHYNILSSLLSAFHICIATTSYHSHAHHHIQRTAWTYITSSHPLVYMICNEMWCMIIRYANAEGQQYVMIRIMEMLRCRHTDPDNIGILVHDHPCTLTTTQQSLCILIHHINPSASMLTHTTLISTLTNALQQHTSIIIQKQNITTSLPLCVIACIMKELSIDKMDERVITYVYTNMLNVTLDLFRSLSSRIYDQPLFLPHLAHICDILYGILRYRELVMKYCTDSTSVAPIHQYHSTLFTSLITTCHRHLLSDVITRIQHTICSIIQLLSVPLLISYANSGQILTLLPRLRTLIQLYPATTASFATLMSHMSYLVVPPAQQARIFSELVTSFQSLLSITSSPHLFLYIVQCFHTFSCHNTLFVEQMKEMIPQVTFPLVVEYLQTLPQVAQTSVDPQAESTILQSDATVLSSLLTSQSLSTTTLLSTSRAHRYAAIQRAIQHAYTSIDNINMLLTQHRDSMQGTDAFKESQFRQGIAKIKQAVVSLDGPKPANGTSTSTSSSSISLSSSSSTSYKMNGPSIHGADVDKENGHATQHSTSHSTVRL